MSVMKRGSLFTAALFGIFSAFGSVATAPINNRVGAERIQRRHGKVRRTATLPSGAARLKRAARKLRNIRARSAK